ncbi:MAG: hypothetical protein BWY77_00290 [bacterium ADurb.Bin431]|nr:MAG: hypothetical protein BWY77_00290 [bacterium ADurb.Bin431]
MIAQDNEQKDKADDQENDQILHAIVRVSPPARGDGRPVEGDAILLADHARKSLHRLEKTPAEIPLLKVWDQMLAVDIPGAGIVDKALDTVTGLDPDFADVGDVEDEEPLVLPLFADAPGLVELVGIGLVIGIADGGHGADHQGDAGLVPDLDGQGLDLGLFGGGNDLGEIIHGPPALGKALLRTQRQNEKKKKGQGKKFTHVRGFRMQSVF